MPLSRVFTPPDTDADPTGDCDRACAVRSFVEHGIYRRPLRHAVHRAVDLSGLAPHTSAFGGKADMTFAVAIGRKADITDPAD